MNTLDVAGTGIHIASGTPGNTSYQLYNNSGTLTWNGTALATGASVSGTTNYLPVFTGSNSLGNSVVYQSGGNVGIGTTSPSTNLEVYQAANSATQVQISTPGTQVGQQIMANFVSKADGNQLGSTANNKGWSVGARGNAWTASDGANSFLISYWNGSAWNSPIEINSSGNVGIGTTNPQDILHIYNASKAEEEFTNSSSVNGGLTVGNNSSAAWVWQNENAPLQFSTNNSERMRITSSGSVGIGTTLPLSNFDAWSSSLNANFSNQAVVGSFEGGATESDGVKRARFVVEGSTNLTNAEIDLRSNDYLPSSSTARGAHLGYVPPGGSNGADGAFVIGVYPYGRVVYIDATNGNVGIGTASPKHEEQLYSNFGFDGGNQYNGIYWNTFWDAPNNRHSMLTTGYGAQLYNDITNGGLYFTIGNASVSGGGAYSSTTPLTLAANGYVGINTTNPTANGLGFSGFANPQLAIYSNGNDGLDIRSDQGNNIINLWQKGSASVTYLAFFTGSGTPTGVGNIYTDTSSVYYNSTSDRRIKENIVLSDKGLDVLMKLPVREFNFIKDAKKKKLQGFVAQELYQIYPQAVTTNGDDGTKPLATGASPWSVDYGRMTPLLTKAIEDLKSLFDADHERLARLGAANDNQAAEIKQLSLANEALKAANDNQGADLKALKAEFSAYKKLHP